MLRIDVLSPNNRNFDAEAEKEACAIREHREMRPEHPRGRRMVGKQRTLAKYKAQLFRRVGN